MSTYWQVSATVSKIITAHGNSPTPAATCRNMTKQTPKSTACVKPTKAAAPPVTKIETEVVESNHIRSFISFDNASAAINKLQEVNVYTAAENIKKLADGEPLYHFNQRSKRHRIVHGTGTIHPQCASKHIQHSGRTYFYREKPCCHCIARSTKELRHSVHQ